MLISSLKLSNFRCFGPEATTVSMRDLTALVGNNGCGKSAVLAALLRLFGTSQTERTLVRSDFHLPKGEDWDEVSEAELEIEARLDFPELKVGATSLGAAATFKQMTIKAPGQRPYCRVRLKATWKQSNLPEGEVEQSLVWVTSAEGVDPEQTTPVLPHDRSRIHVHYIPAVRDPVRQIKQISGSVLHQLLQAVEWSEEVKKQVRDASAELQELFESEEGVQQIQAAIKKTWEELHSSPQHSAVSIRPVAKRFEDLLKQVEATFSPAPTEKEEGIERLSEGQKSLFYLALVASVFDIQDSLRANTANHLSSDKLDPPVLKVFAVEEPENHVAPHYLGRIMATLRRISSSLFGQVVLSSHSPAILARVEPESVRYLRIDLETGRSAVRGILLPAKANDAYKFVREAVRAYPELYFARLVVLGEGDSEEIVLPALAAADGFGTDTSFVSVVPLGGRHVNHFWRLLEHLQVPYLTLLDLDRERQGGGWGRIKYALTQLLEVGRPEGEVLTRTTGGKKFTLKKEQLDEMHNRDVSDIAKQEAWLAHLELHGVYFSQPLDIDFMMLRAYPEAYEATVGDEGQGPTIPDDEDEYKLAVEKVVTAVLKETNTDGVTYDEDETRAFFWYRYLFLGRGKPSTHILALSELSPEELLESIPEVLSRLIARMKSVLKIDVEV
jgi:predicted ATP-dependent endonuclease of OLD family